MFTKITLPVLQYVEVIFFNTITVLTVPLHYVYNFNVNNTVPYNKELSILWVIKKMIARNVFL